ncbi:MAG: hypothetical protein CMM94_00960 [Rickettsiales bacterium]|nr:hypothetical protein [Rickettsiales bacterium]|tara:strand:- start:289 stop:585 length:297 start_codon:yes stop_codon:yes gene_type:complete
MTQDALRDVYDTLAKGAEKRPFWFYVSEVTQTRFTRQKSAAFRHALPVHEGDGHAVDKDSGKPHLANMLARTFIARGQQIQLERGQSMRGMDEHNPDD